MMFKKRKLKREQELSTQRVGREDGFLISIAEIEQLKDPAEKVICLRTIRDTIGAQIFIENETIAEKEETTRRRSFLGGTATFVTSTATSMPLIAASGPIGWAVFGAGSIAYLGMVAVGGKRATSMKKKRELSAADHIQNMKGMQISIDETIDKLLDNNVDTIRVSQYCEEMLALPGISKKFSAAAMNHIGELNKALAASEEAVQQAEARQPGEVSDPPVLKTAARRGLNLNPTA